MRKIWVLVLAVGLLGGCSLGKEKFEMYTDNPEYFIKDPHFADYQGKSDALEKEYLSKKITYADYLQKKTELDNIYSHDVQKRDEIISGGQ